MVQPSPPFAINMCTHVHVHQPGDPMDMNAPLTNSLEIDMQSLMSPPTSSPAMINLKRRARLYNEAIKLGMSIPLKLVDASQLAFIGQPTLQPLQQLSHNHYSELRSHSLDEFHILPKEDKEVQCFKMKVF